MNVQLGKKIKELRKSKNISQEVLAQYLGVSFQAVSKWENEAAMPDVAIIPAIAYFFGVSTDELFDYNRLEAEENIDNICHEAYKYRESDPAKSEAMLREGLKQYPGNEIILNNLLYTMKATERSEEIIAICKSLISRCLIWFQKRQRNQRLSCQHLLDYLKSKRVPEKHLFLLY